MNTEYNFDPFEQPTEILTFLTRRWIATEVERAKMLGLEKLNRHIETASSTLDLQLKSMWRILFQHYFIYVNIVLIKF